MNSKQLTAVNRAISTRAMTLEQVIVCRADLLGTEKEDVIEAMKEELAELNEAQYEILEALKDLREHEGLYSEEDREHIKVYAQIFIKTEL